MRKVQFSSSILLWYHSKARQYSFIFPVQNIPSLAVLNDLLDLGVHPDHLIVQLRVIAPHDLGVPTSSDKDGLDTAGNRCGKDVCDLEADEERKGHDDGGVLAVAVVGGVGEVEVEVGEKGTGVCDKEGAEGKYGSDEAVLYKLAVEMEIVMVLLTLIRASIPRSLIIFHVSLAAAK